MVELEFLPICIHWRDELQESKGVIRTGPISPTECHIYQPAISIPLLLQDGKIFHW